MHPRQLARHAGPLAALAFSIAGCAQEPVVNLSPSHWSDGELQRFATLDANFGGQNVSAESDTGVITGTTGASAIRAGLEALNQGGSAIDAALTTSLTQITLAGGSWVSYAGIFTLVYYDAATGEVHNLNAAYNTIRDEDEPLSIPTADGGPSGRTSLVPGYMAGIEAAHARFGRLPFEQIFAPAIYYADNGFHLSQFHAGMIERRKDVLGRLDETRAVFTKPDGSFYGMGDLFRQPALAETLRTVARDGAAHMYTGPWAEKLVATVRADGGKMTGEDLAHYEVIWAEPSRVTLGDYEIVTHGLPASGGVSLVEALRVASLADLASMGHYAESPEAFFWLAQITDLIALTYVTPEIGALITGGGDTSLPSRPTQEHAERLWSLMSNGQFLLTRIPQPIDPKHSDAIVAIDAEGNIAALVHSINTTIWGSTGIFVDGVSIPDSACFQQQLIKQTGPGQRLPDPTEPLIIFRDGEPRAALSSIGSGLHQSTMCALVNLIGFDMGLEAALGAPSLHLPVWDDAGRASPQVFAGDFDESLIEGVEALGLDVIVTPKDADVRAARGYVIGAMVDLETGNRQAMSSKILNAPALGQ